MKKLIFGMAVAAAMLSVRAQDEDIEEAVEETPAAETAEEDAPAAPKKKADDNGKPFFTLPACVLLDGAGEVLTPAQPEWQPAEEGRFYPLGTVYRTVGADSRMKVQFGPHVDVSLKGDSSFATVAQKLDVATRTIVLKGGTITANLPRNMPEGLFFVTTPGFEVINAAGESSYVYELTGDGEKCLVRCLTGNLAVRGRHFQILPLRASQGFAIRSSSDFLFTALYGKAGDLNVKLDTGLWETLDLDTKEKTSEQRFADFKLSPKTAVRIHRMMPEIGQNMAVTTLTFDANGDRKDRYWFAENHHETTGSDIIAEDDKESEEAARKAAEAADTEAVDADVEDDADDDSAGGASDDDSAGDDADSGDSSDDDDLDF